MRILLISPNTLTAPYPVYPLGLDYVAGSLEKSHQVRIADMNVLDRPALGILLAGFQPELIGISCRNIDNTDATAPLSFVSGYQELILWLRQRSQAPIVCGGCGFTIMPQQVFQRIGADYGIIGEGERFSLLVEALLEKRDPGDIPGILVSSPTAAAPDAVWPSPWQGRIQRQPILAQQHAQYYVANGGMLNLQSKRGCAFRCIYCPYPRIEGLSHRLFDPDEVAATATHLQEAGARYFFITDSAFNSDIDHSIAVAQAMRRAGVHIPWGAFFAPTKLPEGYFEIMREGGCRHVEFGTESLSDAMLRSYRKFFRSADVFAAHNQARAAGLHVAHYFLFGGPGESEHTVRESLDAIEQLNRTVCFFFVGVRIYPGTALYDLSLKEGQISAQTEMLDSVFYQPKAIASEQIEKLIRKRLREANKKNWLLGSGGKQSAQTIHTLYKRGFTGPLWEYLSR